MPLSSIPCLQYKRERGLDTKDVIQEQNKNQECQSTENGSTSSDNKENEPSGNIEQQTEIMNLEPGEISNSEQSNIPHSEQTHGANQQHAAEMEENGREEGEVEEINTSSNEVSAVAGRDGTTSATKLPTPVEKAKQNVRICKDESVGK